MVFRFGFGDYERADVELRDSTSEMRHKFLSVMAYREELLRALVLPHFVQASVEGLDVGELDFLHFAYIALAFGKPILESDKAPEVIINTPFHHLVSLLNENADDIDRVAEEMRKNRSGLTERNIRSDAIDQVVGYWNDLESNPAANEFRTSLLNWAKSNNLNEDWILDFVLMMLKKLMIRFDPIMVDLAELTFDESTRQKYNYIFGSILYQARSDAILEHHSLRVRVNIWRMDETLKYPSFEFRYKDFVMAPVTWLPHITPRSQFISDSEHRFNRLSEALRDLDMYSNLDKEVFYPELETYCDTVEEALGNKVEKDRIKPYIVQHRQEITLNSATWDPMVMTRTDFIGEYLSRLTRTFESYKIMAKSLDPKAKNKIELDLFLYCNKIEKAVPANYEKTPEKYRLTEHFNWLVAFQIPPFKSYREIALTQPESRQITEDAVRKAVTGLGKLLGLRLRSARRTGRPTGIKETKPRGHHYA